MIYELIALGSLSSSKAMNRVWIAYNMTCCDVNVSTKKVVN